MNITVGYIPYLNMVPFHQGFGPEPVREKDITINFRKLSPRALGLEAEAGRIDAGAMSLVDFFRLSDRFEPLGSFGVGVKNAAGSVLLFSKVPMSDFEGMCAVTDETSTSLRLLQVLLEKKYEGTSLNYGRVASSLLFDGSAEGLLLIGDEALKAKKEGIKGLPVITDLATEWLNWQGSPFVFARWAVRKELPKKYKDLLNRFIENSLKLSTLNRSSDAKSQSAGSPMTVIEMEAYWDGFVFELTPAHERSIEMFKKLTESLCLTA
jgi:chorismate dehydratase